MVICFDFDGILSEERFHGIVKKFKEKKCEVWVVTARSDNKFNRDFMKPILDKLFVSFSNVVFCNDKTKIDTLETLNADLYFDNKNLELQDINSGTNTIAVLYI